MQDLRIVGVDTEGQTPRLLLSDSSGTEYALALDESVQSAVADAHTPVREHKITVFSPRDIQARLRGGATVEQVVEDSGMTREHILRYAGPVADERAFFASRARSTAVAESSNSEQHRLAFGDAPATLEAMVKVRLRSIGVALDSMSWDAWRREDGLWAVVCDFDATSSETHAAGIGQRPPAEWVFDPRAGSVTPANEWAEALSALPAAPSRSRTVGRRLAAVDEPFNVDERKAPAADQGGAGHGRDQSSAGQDGAGHEDLLDILRARRGQRLGTDETGDDKLATLLTRDEQPATGHPSSVAERRSSDAERRSPAEQQSTDTLPGLGQEFAENSTETSTEQQKADRTDAWGFSYEETQEEPSSSSEDSSGSAEDTDTHDDAAQNPPAKKRSPSRRPAMPRWDDILFGNKD